MEEPLSTSLVPGPTAPARADWSQVSAPPSMSAPRTSSFDVGQFLSQTFRVWLRGLPLFAPVGVVASLPIAVGVYLLFGRMQGLAGRVDEEIVPVLIGLGVAWLLSMGFMILQMGVVVRGALGALTGERVGMAAMLGGGLRSLPVLVGMTFLIMAAMIPAALLLLFPAFILMSGWCAAVPAVLAERAGPIRALSRSWELTRGYRWHVFAGFSVLTIAVSMVNLVIQSLLGAAFTATLASSGSAGGEAAMAVPMAISQLVGGVLGTVSLVGMAVAYRGLRAAREGADPVVLARVFE